MAVNVFLELQLLIFSFSFYIYRFIFTKSNGLVDIKKRECFGNDGNALLSSLCFLSFGSDNSLLAAGETTPTEHFSLPSFWKCDVS